MTAKDAAQLFVDTLSLSTELDVDQSCVNPSSESDDGSCQCACVDVSHTAKDRDTPTLCVSFTVPFADDVSEDHVKRLAEFALDSVSVMANHIAVDDPNAVGMAVPVDADDDTCEDNPGDVVPSQGP